MTNFNSAVQRSNQKTRKIASSTISSKGQITVPLEIRNRLGVKEGDRVEFTLENGLAILRPAKTPENPFTQFVGVLPAFESQEAINAWIREMRGHDDEAS